MVRLSKVSHLAQQPWLFATQGERNMGAGAMRFLARVCLIGALALSQEGLCQCVAPRFKTPLLQGDVRLNSPEIADLNGDGILDLIFGSNIALGRSDGTFADLVPIVSDQFIARGLPRVADLNNDGLPDVIVPGGDAVEPCGGGVEGGAFLSSPNGLFSVGFGISGADGLNVLVDWDGDGNLDMVGGGVVGSVGGPGHCAIVIRRGDGAGRFARSVEVGSASLENARSTLAVADFDGDGRLDLAYADEPSEGTRRLRVLHQSPDGMLTEPAMFETSLPVPAGVPRILASADFDNDGRPDLLLLSGDAFIAFLNRGGGAFEAVSSSLGGLVAWDYRVADFNADGIPDVALLSVRAGLTDSVVILCGEGTGRFFPCATMPLPPSVIGTWLRVGDFDGDGRPDLVIDGRTASTAGFLVALNECPFFGSLIGVIPTVSSAGGLYGAFFKTRLELENACVDESCVDVVEGRLVFHPRGRPGSDFDHALPFRLAPSEILRFHDVVAEMGAQGSGSLDVIVSRGPAPVVRAEVFNSKAGEDVRGSAEPAITVRDALTIGYAGDLSAPVDLTNYRFAIGLRTLAEGATLRATVRDLPGRVVKVVHRSFGPYRSVQESAQEFLGGFALVGQETVSLSLLGGSAIIFGTTADNATSTPAIQIPRPPRRILARGSTIE
ncbi:MAG: FG-GAP repeat domain-containing protein [Thermoanaerobaculia bacterium]